MKKSITRVGGQELALSNLEKILYPSYGFTKAQVLDYYRRVARFILPHLQGRALTLKRYPDGVKQPFFFEKRCPPHPAWVATARVRRREGGQINACLVNDLRTLVWVENLASLELHVPLARADSPDRPDALVFDLDPGEKAGLVECARVALILRDLLRGLHLETWVKTSGMKGLHLYVPLNRKTTTFQETRDFTKAVAEVVERNYPDLVTAKMAKEQRKGKVFINWSQNDAKKTMVAVYSLRAREAPYVSFPLTWTELGRAAARKSQTRLQVLHSKAVRRLERQGDLFRDLLKRKQKLPAL